MVAFCVYDLTTWNSRSRKNPFESVALFVCPEVSSNKMHSYWHVFLHSITNSIWFNYRFQSIPKHNEHIILIDWLVAPLHRCGYFCVFFPLQLQGVPNNLWVALGTSRGNARTGRVRMSTIAIESMGFVILTVTHRLPKKSILAPLRICRVDFVEQYCGIWRCLAFELSSSCEVTVRDELIENCISVLCITEQ